MRKRARQIHTHTEREREPANLTNRDNRHTDNHKGRQKERHKTLLGIKNSKLSYAG